jgi:hypothetical protein
MSVLEQWLENFMILLLQLYPVEHITSTTSAVGLL